MSQQAFTLLHRKIQQAIWDQKWSELRALQVDTILAVNGSDSHLILSAATASGKTEAAFLPVLSSIATNPQPSIQALYIGPLKALINDQFRRLEVLCQHAQIPVHRWHGDVPKAKKDKMRKEPKGVLLITPESLESNFINYGHQIARLYTNLEYVIIDELHSFIGDTRGVHLMSLLSRLEKEIGRPVRKIGLSATLGDFKEAQRFIDPDNPDRSKVLEEESGQREVKLSVRSYLLHDPKLDDDELEDGRDTPFANTPQEAEQIAETFDTKSLLLSLGDPFRGQESQGERKAAQPTFPVIATSVGRRCLGSSNLVFCNSRNMTERLADSLNSLAKVERWPKNPFLLHHGSLSADVRHEAESRLKRGEPVTAICTSTLEMGVDIGSVKSVFQLGSPYCVNSLVQRLGRSGRRKGEAAILRMITIDRPPQKGCEMTDLLYPDLITSIALIELMIEKWLEPPAVEHYSASTLIHQTISILRQTGGIEASALFDTLCTKGPFRAFDPSTFKRTLRSLHSKEIIEQLPTGELILAPKGETIVQSRDFYASFASTEEFSVKNTGFEIAKLPRSTIPPPPQQIILNGRRWTVTEIDEDSKTAYVQKARTGSAPIFGGEAGDIHLNVRQKMRQVLNSEQQYTYLDSEGSRLLRAARLFFGNSGLKAGSILYGSSDTLLFPWAGTKALQTLILIAKLSGFKKADCDYHRLYIKLPPQKEKILSFLELAASGIANPSELAELLDQKHYGKFDMLLDEELLNQVNATDRLDLEGAAIAAKKLLFDSCPTHEETSAKPTPSSPSPTSSNLEI